MLVLARRVREQIEFLGLGITITILEIRGGKVRIGFDAPASVKIARKELLVDVASAQPPQADAGLAPADAGAVSTSL